MVRSKEENRKYMRLYRLKNKEKLNEYKKNWLKQHPDYRKEEGLIYSKQYRKNNPEKILSHNKEWREKNLNYAKNKSKEWHKNHPNYNKEYNNKYPEKMKIWRSNNSDKIKIYSKRTRYKRKNWGIEPINKYFKNSHFHHLHVDENHNVGIYVPAELHNSIWHSYKDQESMNKINKAVIEWYN